MDKRISQTRQVSLSDLTPYPNNPRRGDIAAIRESLEITGQYRALVVRSDTREVLAGNHTLAAMRELGYEKALCHLVDVDDEQARRIVLVDNRSNDLAGYDNEALLELLQSLPNLSGTGYTDKSMASLLKDIDDNAAEFDPAPAMIPEAYEVIVTCKSEEDQVALLERLSGEGMECRALLS